MARKFMRYLIHPIALIFYAVVVLIMAVLTGLSHYDSLLLIINSVQFDTAVQLEEDIAVLLVAFGVILEEIPLFNQLYGAKENEQLEEKTTELGEYYGAYLLLIGLFMEANDLCFEPLLLKIGWEQVGVFAMLLFDALAILFCIAFIVKMFRVTSHK